MKFVKKLKKSRISTFAFSALLTLSVSSSIAMAATHSYEPFVKPLNPTSYSTYSPSLTSPNWDNRVKDNINELLKTYGNTSPTYDAKNKPYAVFDFDNTTSILDVEEQLMIWQLEHLQFAMTPEKFAEVIRTGISDANMNLTYGADNGSGNPARIGDVIDDVTKDYAILYKEKAINPDGKMPSEAVRNSAVYKDFVTKTRWLYDAIDSTMDDTISYPWITYLYTGMTPKQVHDMAYASDSYYSDPNRGQKFEYRYWTSPDQQELATKAGQIRIKFRNGVTVSPELKELYGALNKNGIDTWIDTASHANVVQAAVDYFKIPGVKGIVGFSNKLDDKGRFVNEYDYDLHPQTQKAGKADTIDKIIAPKYHHQGPIFTAMDSQGDFNFNTEYKNTKAVLILNRIRKDDAGICSAAAVYQAKKGINLADAVNNGDALYLLQGRNENTGKLISSPEAINLGKDKPELLSPRSEKALADLESGMSLKDMFQKDTKLKNYQGYKTR